jgi:hypothetical protein
MLSSILNSGLLKILKFSKSSNFFTHQEPTWQHNFFYCILCLLNVKVLARVSLRYGRYYLIINSLVIKLINSLIIKLILIAPGMNSGQLLRQAGGLPTVGYLMSYALLSCLYYFNTHFNAHSKNTFIPRSI